MKKKKNNKKKSFIFKTFIYWFIVILFLEMVFALYFRNGLDSESIINIVLNCFIVGSILSTLSFIFSDKVNKFITSIFLFILGVIFSLQFVFYNTFKSYFSLSVLGLSDQLESFMDETINAIIGNIIFIILFFTPFILYLIFKKKLGFRTNNWKNYLFNGIILLLSGTLFIVHMNNTVGDTSTYNLFYNINEISLNVPRLGVINSYALDLYRTAFGFEDKIDIVDTEEEEEEKEIVYEKNILELDFTKETSNKDIKNINAFMENEVPTSQNEYTGIFEGYNLIYITAESFSEIAVSETLTPTLYKLIHSGFHFNNYYTPNNLSTIGGEFQSLTGLYPDNSILSTWRKGKNYFPYGLATVFKGLDYNTYAYHNNWYKFQDRHQYIKSQGFTNYLGCSNGLEKKMNCKQWPESDLSMMQVTVGDYINSEKPFLAYYMTVSGHFEYTFSDNSIAYKNKKYVNDLKVGNNAKAYVATQIELDKALEYLISKLEEAGKLDNTVIVLLADHYPYELDLKSINSLSSYTRDSVVEVNHNALIIWNNQMENEEINKVCMSVDVLPTVYNLFGVEYDSRLLIGKDIFSDTEGLAVFKNHSWVSDNGVYLSSGSKFTPKVDAILSEDYVSNVNKTINNRLNVSKWIIKNDYYKYLLK